MGAPDIGLYLPAIPVGRGIGAVVGVIGIAVVGQGSK